MINSQVESGTCPGFPRSAGTTLPFEMVYLQKVHLSPDMVWYMMSCDLMWGDVIKYDDMIFQPTSTWCIAAKRLFFCRPHLVSTYPNRCVHAHKQDKGFLCPSTLVCKRMESFRQITFGCLSKIVLSRSASKIRRFSDAGQSSLKTNWGEKLLVRYAQYAYEQHWMGKHLVASKESKITENCGTSPNINQLQHCSTNMNLKRLNVQMVVRQMLQWRSETYHIHVFRISIKSVAHFLTWKRWCWSCRPGTAPENSPDGRRFRSEGRKSVNPWGQHFLNNGDKINMCKSTHCHTHNEMTQNKLRCR